MKQLLLAFTLLVALASATSSAIESDRFEVQATGSKYHWISDIIRFSMDSIILLLTGGFLWFASFFANCQECYVSYVTALMNAKFFRLSYKYV